MNKEFDLSKKRKEITINNKITKEGIPLIIPKILYAYPEKDVKEFIKKLKEEYNDFAGKNAISMPEFEKIIDKLVGEKLR